MPPEYCEYGPDYETHCVPWLKKTHPELLTKYVKAGAGEANTLAENIETDTAPLGPWTIEDRICAFYSKYMPEKLDGIPALLEKYEGKEDKLFTALVKKYGAEPEDPYITKFGGENDGDDDVTGDVAGLSLSSDVDAKKRRGAGAKKVAKVDTRVIIQKITRNRKKAVTHVVGLDTVPDLLLKDAAKAFSKRFAGSSSVKDTPGGKEIIIQGDHQDDCADMIVKKFKVTASCVFLDIDGEFVPFA
jgi:density-regulated protein DRP1